MASHASIHNKQIKMLEERGGMVLNAKNGLFLCILVRMYMQAHKDAHSVIVKTKVRELLLGAGSFLPPCGLCPQVQVLQPAHSCFCLPAKLPLWPKLLGLDFSAL